MTRPAPAPRKIVDLHMPGDDPVTVVEFSAVETTPPRRGDSAGMRTWDVTYASASGNAHFGISMELRPPRADDEFPSTRGVLTAREDSRPGALLAALARAHHLPGTTRIDAVPSWPDFEPVLKSVL